MLLTTKIVQMACSAKKLSKNYFKVTSPVQLIQIQNNFTYMLLLMPSTRIAQSTQASSDRAKKGEITLNDICLLLVIVKNITLCARIQASNPGTLTTLLFSHVRTCQPLFSLGSAHASY